MKNVLIGRRPAGALAALLLVVTGAAGLTTGCGTDDDADADDTTDRTSPDPSTGAGATSRRAAEAQGIPAALGVLGDVWLLDLPTGEPGQVSIIARQDRSDDRGTMSVVIRNNTDAPVANVQLTGEVTDDTGASLGQVISQSSFEPPVIQPGEIAIGWVFVHESRRDGTTTFTVTSDPADAVDPENDYATVEVTKARRSDGRLDGVLLNANDRVAGPLVAANVLCFGGDGSIGTYHEGFADQMALRPGADGSFSIDLGSDACEVGLVGSHGDPDV